MSDTEEAAPQLEGTCGNCGHAIEAHSDLNGCELCDCTEALDRNFSGGSNGETSMVEAPPAEGGGA